ncbi:MAG: sensor histidine kinase [Balneolia bacterium]|nr:sensor histidine kinase [Balneolia bacterium]
MNSPVLIAAIAFGYLSLLFLIAYLADKRAKQGKSLINNPWVYSLSLAVYCTAWTFYGSVGRAAETGLGFLPIYLGPTLMAALFFLVLRRMIRISRHQRITSIADFIGSRYGKSTLLAGVVTVIAVLGIIPYISLQLKAISSSYTIMTGDLSVMQMGWEQTGGFFLTDTAFYVTLVLGVFTILFGARELDASEKHEGMVAAIAFESVVKLLAFTAAGLFVVFVMYGSPAELFRAAWERPEMRQLFSTGEGSELQRDWIWLTILSMPAILLLPRQFQTAVVENVNEDHVRSAAWMFPLYLLIINIFVLPIALAGLMHPGLQGVDADSFVLSIPLIEGQSFLAILVFTGGLSAATSMVIVATIALSTMLSNDLIMPALLRSPRLGLLQQQSPGRLILLIRRVGIFVILLLAYLYFRFIGEDYSLVSIGLVSFAAVAQFAPALFIGMFWYGATRTGALAGIISGFVIWAYTLVIPSVAGISPFFMDLTQNGPWGVELLRPGQLLGITGYSTVAQSVFWSLSVNTLLLLVVSAFSRQTPLELSQAALFVEGKTIEDTHAADRQSEATVGTLKTILTRFLGERKASETITTYENSNSPLPGDDQPAPLMFIGHAEKQLAGAIGSSSARLLMAMEVRQKPMSITEIRGILDETRQVLQYSRQLQETSEELRQANEQLRQLDEMKDEFVATVTHELKTPLTSIRALTEILRDTPDVKESDKARFLDIIGKETERLTRLINQLLDTQKANTGTFEIESLPLRMEQVVQESMDSMEQVFREKKIDVAFDAEPSLPGIQGDADRLKQVVLNLLSNAVRYGSETNPAIEVRIFVKDQKLMVEVTDNGPGIAEEDQERIFKPFSQTGEISKRKSGTGLGLSISRKIMSMHGGRLLVKSRTGEGSRFIMELPLE